MAPPTATAIPSSFDYPDSDGKPVADNTEQFRWIVVLFGNLCALFREVNDIFIAADLLWYPVEREWKIRNTPDVLVVFGRPRGKRGSYRQWEEGDVPMTVVFEILSPVNTTKEMSDKQAFYETHGVEEYYIYDPDTARLQVFLRKGAVLVRRRFKREFVSPRLGIRFDLSGPEMMVYYPDGRRFLTFEELEAARTLAEQRADDEAERADVAEQRADNEADRADTEAQRADSESQRADTAEQRARRLAQLSRRARLGQASVAELAELEQLERDSGI